MMYACVKGQVLWCAQRCIGHEQVGKLIPVRLWIIIQNVGDYG